MGLMGLGRIRLDRRAAAFAVAVLALVHADACGTGGSADETVIGHVTDVSAKSLLEIDVLTIEDGDRVVRDFSGRGYRGVSPSHLRQHMLQGLQIVVTYRDNGEDLLITEIRDHAPGATPAPHE